MSCYYFSEIHVFDLDNFIPYMGWIGGKPVKIYTREGISCYYLYDEELGQLFEVHFKAPNSQNTTFRYDQVLDDYRQGNKSGPTQ